MHPGQQEWRMGTGSGQPGPYVTNVPAQHSPENGTYGGGPPQGFTGMSSPYYQQSGSKSEASSSCFNLTLGCRIAALVLSLLSLAVVASSNQSKQGFATPEIYVWANYKVLRDRAGKYMVAICAIVLVYEVAQIVLSCLDRTRAITFMSSYSGLLATFIVDQVLAYLAFAADAALADKALVWRHDRKADGNTACYGWKSWCSQVEAGLAMGFLAFGALAVIAAISGMRIKLSSNS